MAPMQGSEFFFILPVTAYKIRLIYQLRLCIHQVSQVKYKCGKVPALAPLRAADEKGIDASAYDSVVEFLDPITRQGSYGAGLQV